MKVKKLLTIFLVSCTLAGCAGPVTEEPAIVVVPERERVSYSTAVVTRADLKSTKSVSCTYKQQQETTVIIPNEGKYVSEVCVKKGDAVQKGQLLAKLGSNSLEEEIEELTYGIERNKILLKYTDENDTYAREDLEDAIYLDELYLEKLQAELSENRVYAEADGVITWVKNGLLGSTSKANDRVMTIVDTADCIFTVTKNKYTEYLAKDKNVSMKINIGEAAGIYELIPVNTDEWGDYFYFELSPDYDRSIISVGTTGYITVTIGEREQVLKIPAKAIHEASDMAFVYVLDENDVRTVKWITTGLTGDDGVEVLTGLTEGETVLLK